METPEKYIHSTLIDTPVGEMTACAIEDGICLLEFSDRRMLPTEFKQLMHHFKAEVVEKENMHFQLLREQLAAYFEGSLKTFDLPLIMPGSPFQQKAWAALKHIPYGQTVSYKDQALVLNDVNATRAVARANGMNRIAIIVPCHRVIGEDGKLIGYGGGLHRKKWLLEHEARHSAPGALFS